VAAEGDPGAALGLLGEADKTSNDAAADASSTSEDVARVRTRTALAEASGRRSKREEAAGGRSNPNARQGTAQAGQWMRGIANHDDHTRPEPELDRTSPSRRVRAQAECHAVKVES